MNLNLIPQVFYDLIARLIPGLILIWSSCLIYFAPSIRIEHLKKLFAATRELNLSLIILALLIAYSISIILNGLLTLLSDLSSLFKKLLLPYEQNRQELIDVTTKDKLKVKQATKTIQNDEDTEAPSSHFVYDYIRFRRPDVGARLVKIKAEIRMCKVLIFGWIILIFLNFYNVPNVSTREFIIIECTLLIGIIGVFRFFKKLNEKFHTGLVNHWKLLHGERQAI